MIALDFVSVNGAMSKVQLAIWLRDNHDLINPRLYAKIDLAAIRQDRLRKQWKATDHAA